MRRIGVRALQQNAAAVLKKVRAGEVMEVTDRGRPVARLVPASGRELLDLLEDSGALRRADGDLLDLDDPPKAPASLEMPSKRLARMRARER